MPPLWASMEIFRGLSSHALTELVNVLEPMEYRSSDTILTQGESGDDMFLLDSGSVRVVVRDDEGRVYFQKLLEAPAHFGEMALIIREPRTASIVAETPVRALRMSRDALRQVVRRNPDAAGFLTRAVGERLLESDAIRQVGKYRVVGRLGSGGVATVFEGIHPDLGLPVALKMLSHTLILRPGFADRFLDEARIIAGLEHPNIVRVLDTQKAFGTHFIVMEKLTGTLLEDIVVSGSRLPWTNVRRMLEDICTGLQFSHDHGILHRDIKPANAFLTADGKVKILDFGIAVEEDSSATTGTWVSGTPAYMAPEQIRGKKLDGRVDLYAVGITAYELCTGMAPFDHEDATEVMRMQLEKPMPDPRRINPDTPDDLCEFIRRCTEKNPKNRYKTGREAADFVKTARESTRVEALELATVAVAYHPAQRDAVERAVRAFNKSVEEIPGVSLLQSRGVAGD